MLSSLRIENIAIIEKADIQFDIGLNVLSGETGAGKSIIIDAIHAVLGERTSKELIRTGAATAKVTALFQQISGKISVLLKELEIDEEEDGTLLVQRTIHADGKNICKINGCPVTVSMLRQVGRELINIHGQHDNQTLLSQENHCKLIDLMARDDALLQQYEKVFRRYVSVKNEIKTLETDLNEKEKEKELLYYQIDELESAGIKEGELDTLIKYRNKCMNSEKILTVLQESYDKINGIDEQNGVLGDLKSISVDLDGIKENFNEVVELSVHITEMIYQLDESLAVLRNGLNSFDFDQQELTEVEERIDLLYRLSHKYGETEADMLTFLEACREKVKNIEFSDERLVHLNDELQKTGEELICLAEELSEIRRKTGERFSQEIKQELDFLDMPNVTLSVVQNEKPFGSKGKDHIEFFISTNAGESQKALAKIASGGELSRIMLAIKNVLNQVDDIGTMIFDEIDAGVSGKAAQKIALKLAEVSLGKQVICVTHLAQIAAQADRHLLIEKSTVQGHTYTQVRTLTQEGSKYEIARIIGGMVITQSQLKAAEELLEQAKRDKITYHKNKEESIYGTEEN